MAKRKFHLSEQQIKEVKRYEQSSKRPAELKRLQAIRLYGTGHQLSDIMNLVGCGESSVRIWAMQYTQKGISGVLSDYSVSSQNARKLSVDQEQELREKLHHYRPDQVMALDECHGRGAFWTVEDVKEMIWRWYGVIYRDASSYRHVLHRCGFSYQKAEQVYKSRPSEVDIADFEAELEKK